VCIVVGETAITEIISNDIETTSEGRVRQSYTHHYMHVELFI